MNTTVTFDGAAPAGTINLGIGQPSADLLPVDLMRQASDAFFEQAHPHELNYGEMQGDGRFLQSLAGFLTEGYGAPASAAVASDAVGNVISADFLVGTQVAPSGPPTSSNLPPHSGMKESCTSKTRLPSAR